MAESSKKSSEKPLFYHEKRFGKIRANAENVPSSLDELQPTLYRLPIPPATAHPTKQPKITKPTLLGYYEAHDTGYIKCGASPPTYVEPRIGENLKRGFDTFLDKRPFGKSSLDGAVRIALDKRPEVFRNTEKPVVITFRNNLNKLMGTPYDAYGAFDIDVCRRGNVIFLGARSIGPVERATEESYTGRRFEHICTRGPAEYETTAVTCRREVCGVYMFELGDMCIIEAAEIDCVSREKDGRSETMELKCMVEPTNESMKNSFANVKALKWWIQSFLSNTRRVVCGIRDTNGTLIRCKHYQTNDLCKQNGHWHFTWCLRFTAEALKFIAAHTADSVHARISHSRNASELIWSCRINTWSDQLPPPLWKSYEKRQHEPTPAPASGKRRAQDTEESEDAGEPGAKRQRT